MKSLRKISMVFQKPATARARAGSSLISRSLETTPGNLLTRFAAALSCVAFMAGLAACGGGSDDTSPSLAKATALAGGDGDRSPDPLKKYREQTVQWTECDPDLLEEDVSDIVHEAGDRLRCARVSAPLDWSDAERGDIVIGMLRLEAAKPEKRRGALLFNPGGPGGDGLSDPLIVFQTFKDSDPNDPLGARKLRLFDEYDMVGFSPRGLGASTQYQCAGSSESDTLLVDFVDLSPGGWDDPGNIARIHRNAGKLAQACRTNPITPYINTDATARDMELLRTLLGDDKLNYVGYSYGTWLGAWYASLFPDRVGRMVLDGAMDFTSTFQEAELANGAAEQRLFDEVLAPYAARHHDYFGLGTSEAEVRAAARNLSSGVQLQLSEQSALLRDLAGADGFLLAISAARGLDTILKLPVIPELGSGSVLEALKGYRFHSSNEAIDSELRKIAGELAEGYFADLLHQAQGQRAYLLDPSTVQRQAILCNDTPATTDTADWAAKIRSAAQLPPMFFGHDDAALYSSSVCVFWGGPSVNKPDHAPMRPLDVLFVQSEYDVATPAEEANAFFTELPQARRVYVRGGLEHGLFVGSGNACVDSHVTDYLLGESPAQRETECHAKPLKQDALSLEGSRATASAHLQPA